MRAVMASLEVCMLNAITMLEAATIERSVLGKQHRKEIRRLLGEVYGIARTLADDEDQWFDFTCHSRWEGKRSRPKIDDRKDAFDFVARFYAGFDGRNAQKKASLIKCALRPFFDKGVPASKIPRLLRTSGGISGLAQKHRADEKAAQIVGAGGHTRPPVPTIVLRKPTPVFAAKIERFSKRGEVRIAANTVVGEDGRVFLDITRVKRAPQPK